MEIKDASNSQRSTSHYFTWATTPTFTFLHLLQKDTA